MKRFCLSVFAVASMLLAASCQQELNPVTDGDTTVTFTVNAGDVATRAIADGTNVDALHWEIYKTDDVATATQPLGEDTIIDKDGNKEFTVELKLLADQKYTIIFWAEVDGAGHYDTGDLRNVGMNYKQENGANIIDANDESRAAFFRVYPFETENGKTITETIELYRPFSQLNLGATTYETSFNNVNEGKVKIEASEIKVTNVATTFNTIHLGADGKYGQGTGKIAATFLTGDNTLRTPNEPADDTQKLLEVNDLYYYWLGMNYLIVSGENTDNVDVDITLDTNFGEVKHTISSVPVKENYRTNLLGNFLTTGATFNVVVDEEFNKPDEVVVVGSTVVRTSAELAAALKEDKEHINIFLDEVGNVVTRAGEKKEFEIAIGAWTEEYYFGGASTKTITINANGNKINFVHENGDWNYIRCVNDAAKWIINDATLTNSGKNNGPWNRHDIRFYNAVELNNVTSDKAIALLNDGKLNNVQISDVHPENSKAYGLWITAEGQTVSLDGVTITPSEGKTTDRAIKIADEYVDSPAKVTLSVENSTFVSQEKAAVLVTSTAGATINWGAGNDIKGVAADPINAVWVDEDRADYASEVNVKGASMVVEGAVANVPASGQDALEAALKEAAKNPETTVVVNVAADTYGTLPALSSNVVLNCAEGTVFQGNSKANINGATVIGAKFSNPSGTAVDQTINGTFKDCVFEGANALRWCYAGETVVFENCVFSGSTYGVHFDGGANEVLFKNCTFSGFNAFGAAIRLITFDGCTFQANGKSGYNGVNLWGSTKMLNTEFIFDGNATYEWVDCLDAHKEYEFTTCTINNTNFLNETYVSAAGIIKVDGTDYDLNNSTFISTAEELFAFANEVNVNNNAFNGKTVYLVADIDLDDAPWTPVGQTGATTFNGVFDGQNYTISNLNVNSEAQTGKHYSSGLFGWVESHTAGHGHIKNVKIAGATISGHHNCGALVGYITQETALVENCHVTGATITCTKANDDADGDKAGALIGNATVATPVKDCTASNSTVSAGRDAGQVIGAGKEANVTGCSASNVTVEANGTSTSANVRNEVIGRLL